MITFSGVVVLLLGLLVGLGTHPAQAAITVMGEVLDFGNNDPTDGMALDLRVGETGVGVLIIDAGSSVTADGGTVLIGTFGGAHGTVLVSGASSRLDATPSLIDFVVAEGLDSGIPNAATTGTLAIVQGGVVTAGPRLTVGNHGIATGMVTVDGAGSRLETGLDLHVGPFGSGTISVSNGGVLATGTASNTEPAFLAFGSGGVGHVAVRGPGATWTHSNEIAVGHLGTGSLVVDGAGANVETGLLTVGVAGRGSAVIANGGVMSSGSPAFAVPDQIGRDPGSVGHVVVTGSSSWMFDRAIAVGDRGTGTLSVLDGGQVVVKSTALLGSAHVGRDSGSVGTVAVSGSTSLVEVRGVLTLGLQFDLTTPGGAAMLAACGSPTVRVKPDAGGQRDILVGPGGVLKGDNIVDANVVNLGGVVQPGCSPGVMRVLGRYTGRPGSRLVLEIDANGAHDVLDVRDGLTLDPASQVVILLDPDLQVTAGQTFPLIQSDNGASLKLVGTPTGSVEVQSTTEFSQVTPEIREERVTSLPDGALQVAIDIKPGDFPNSINLGSAGVVPVAILSSPTIDATRVDPASLTLAGAAVRLIGHGKRDGCQVTDVNGDSRLDLVCQFETQQLTLTPGDAVATLTGRTFAGTSIEGHDSVRIVP